MSHYEPKEPFDGYDPDDKYPEMMDFIIRTESLQANALGEWILERLNPKSVIDVGCGPGIYLLPFQERGLRVLGIDACHIGGECLEEGNFQRVDLRFPFVPEEKFDLAICFEVAEHLERHWSERLVDTLSECADVILFTGAVPGQGGTYHINEQPHEFWLDMFKERHGYVVHPLQDNLREFLATLNPYRETEEVSGWLVEHCFILVRESALHKPEWTDEALQDCLAGAEKVANGEVDFSTKPTQEFAGTDDPNEQNLIPPDGKTLEEVTTVAEDLSCVECGDPCDGSVRNDVQEPLCIPCGEELGYVQTTTEETPEVTKVDEIVAGTGDENPKPKRTRKAKSKEE